MSENPELALRSINTIRFLAADAIQRAQSGHPGLPLGAAPMAYVLWMQHLKHNPSNPNWPDRDRFVLSAGHGSALLYALLHLTGYDLSLDELKNFRQWGSKTPGHPESFITPGVDVTTGPLGQGFANAVGMAIAEAHLAARFNKPEHKVVDHYTYVIAGDGDLMEGVATEACSLAGHLKLGKLIVLYDSNDISLAGSTRLTFTEDVGKHFEACGWHCQTVAVGNDIAAIDDAISNAKSESSRPSLISIKTVIGYGSPNKQGTFAAHGAPLGPDELKVTKQKFDWPIDKDFFIPDDVAGHFRKARENGSRLESEWKETFEKYYAQYPEFAVEFERRFAGKLPYNWDKDIPRYTSNDSPIPTRKASEAVMQAIASRLPELIGGCADLNPSTFAWLKGYGDFQPPDSSPEGLQGVVGGSWNYEGRNIHFGVREHVMGAIANGLALHGGFLPFTGTFFVFSDYMRPPMRLAALSCLKIIFIFSHDSIGVGEDGPTHQPIEHLMNLRAVPNLTVIRPADAAETIESWRAVLQNDDGPTALILTRQKVPVLDRSIYASADGLHKGAYTLWQSGEGIPDIIIIATGSEVHIALDAAKMLDTEAINVRVVSIPSWELFDKQDKGYCDSVLPSSVKARIAVEAGIKLGWERYVGLEGVIIGMDSFGASAPGEVLYEKFGITAEAVYKKAKELLKD